MDLHLLLNIFVFLVAGCLVVPAAQRFRLGPVLGYLIAGVVIGPFGLSLISQPDKVMQVAEIGVIMMMFLIGMELEPAVLWRMRRAIIGLGSAQVTVTSLIFMVVGMMLGHTWQGALAVGMAMAMSSTALVMQMLNERNLTHSLVGETSFAILLFQDISVIPILIIIPLLGIQVAGGAAPADHSLITLWPDWLKPIVIIAVVAAVILAGRYASRYVFQVIAKSNLREVFTATSLAIVIGVTVLMEAIGVSPALGAFIAGVVLANSEYRRTIETDIEPFKGLLLGLFFMSVGMAMDFTVLWRHPGGMIGALVVLMAVKGLILFGLGDRFGVKGIQGLGLAIGLAQGGEFAFVLLQLIGGLKLIDAEAQKFLILLVAISIAATPVLVMLYSRYAQSRFMSTLPRQDYDSIEEHNTVIIAGFGRFGQITGRFIMAQGVAVTVLEKNPDQVEALRRFGFKAYFGDATRVDLLRSAGADEARLLIVAVDDADAAVEIVRLCKQHFKKLRVIARARNRRHAYDLYKAGVDSYHRELLDASLAVGREAMEALGRDSVDMQKKAETFLAHDIATLRKSFEFFENEPEMVNFAKLRREELEGILKEDKQES